MKRKPMDLGVFCFPGGVQYSNRARMVRGDYESIAFIGPSGLVRWDIPRAAVNAAEPVICARIDLDAAETRSAYMRQLSQDIKTRPAATLDRLLDMCPASLLVDFWSWPGSMQERAQALAEKLIFLGRL